MTTGRRFGVFLTTRLAATDGEADPEPVLALGARAEELGLDSIWVGDSVLARPRFEPLVMLSALAARTRRIALGTAVLLPGLRQPVLLAHAVSTLDQVSGGRLVLGVGSGFNYKGTRLECEAVGVPYRGRIRRMTETISRCREIWSGGAVGGASEKLFPPPSRPGGPPIWMGGNVAAAFRRAGQMADGWLPTVASAEAFREGWSAVQEAAKEAGREPSAVTPAWVATVNINEDGAAATAEMRRYIEAYYEVRYEAASQIMACYAGTRDGFVSWARDFLAAGVRHMVVRFAGTDQKRQLEILSEALPALRSG